MYASIYVYVCVEIYYKELAYMLIEAEKSVLRSTVGRLETQMN